MALDLTPFKTVDRITWTRHTVFEPHRGDDGNLRAYNGDGQIASIPLDTWTPDSPAVSRGYQPMTDNVGIVVVDPTTLDDVHNAIRDWCRDQLGRNDVTFS
ncbi:hypothetical protein [Amycolatopsis sp. DSM 110486]|uniref:hypothetical protein n=1 Tax=Amycolatopsis sp. DSM 110486 TaxID=2865832 RepID=UPI001C69CC15|nr:hypothetical protein [Amycolatopsis sp. DSM 110486]QYN17507.1 hypothetical protein K1T34_32495 [Amycolatopsis sp. DSM 110486]